MHNGLPVHKDNASFFSFAMTFNDNSPFFQSLYAVFSVEQIRILAVFFVFGGRYKKESLKPMI